MQSYLQTQPARAVTLLPLAEDLLKHVAGCIAVRSMAVAMVVGCLCLRLADFLIAVLRVRRALTEDDPQVRPLLLLRFLFPLAGRHCYVRFWQGPSCIQPASVTMAAFTSDEQCAPLAMPQNWLCWLTLHYIRTEMLAKFRCSMSLALSIYETMTSLLGFLLG